MASEKSLKSVASCSSSSSKSQRQYSKAINYLVGNEQREINTMIRTSERVASGKKK